LTNLGEGVAKGLNASSYGFDMGFEAVSGLFGFFCIDIEGGVIHVGIERGTCRGKR
jgi:hypothetical protein